MRGGRWRGVSRQQSAARYRDGGHGEREGQDHHQARPHAVLPPGKMTRLTTAALSKPKSNKITNCIELTVTVRQMASATPDQTMTCRKLLLSNDRFIFISPMATAS